MQPHPFNCPFFIPASRRTLACTGLLLILAACTRGSGHFVPLAPDHWSVFAVTSTILDETYRSRYVSLNIGDVRVEGQPYAARRTQTGTLELLRESAHGIERIGTGRHGAVTYDNPARLLVPAGEHQAAEWQVPSTLGLVESRTFARGDRIIVRRYPLQIHKTVGGVNETVTVPAGTFHGCLRIDGRGATTVPTDRRNSAAAVTVATREWYAPGVGLVQLERTEASASSFLKTGRQTWVLLDFGD